MKHKIAAGVLLIEKGTLVPDSMRVRSEPYSEGWESVRNLNSRELNRGLHGAGWTFSFLADEVHKSSLGFDKQRARRAAVKRLLTSMKSRCLNCLDVHRVKTRSFLGLHFVSVFAQPRNIQKSCALPAPAVP